MIITKLIKALIKIAFIFIGTVLIVRLFPDFMLYLAYTVSEYWETFIVLLILNTLFYRYVLKPRIFIQLHESTVRKVTYMLDPYVSIGIVGDVGNDKSSLGVFFTQVLELNNIHKLEEEYQSLRTVLSVLDFHALDQFFYKNYQVQKVYTREEYIEFGITALATTNQLDYLFDKEEGMIRQLRFKPFELHNVDELLGLYFEDMYYITCRQVHVISNTAIESVVTGHHSIIFKESVIRLFKDNDLAFERFLVINEDEKGITDNSRVNSRRDKESLEENEDGKDAYYMTLRHLGEGTNVHININQRVEDVTAFMRRLYQIFLQSEGRQEIYLYDIEMSLLERISMLVSIMEEKYQTFGLFNARLKKKLSYNAYKKAVMKYNPYLDKNNGFKKVQRWMYTNIQRLSKRRYKRNIVALHERVEDVGKDILDPRTKTKSLHMNIIYDVNWVYGKYSTHALRYIRDIRNKKATIPLAVRERFTRKQLDQTEYRKMDYRQFNRILDSIESQNHEELFNKDSVEKDNTKKAEDTEVNFDAWD